MVNPSPAVLFRVIDALRPTLLIDEVERLNTKDHSELRSIVNSGYKRGATVPRVEGEARELRFFEVYSPKCLAGIRGVGAVTEDRCITIVMSRPPADDQRQNQVVDSSALTWEAIRSGFYRLTLEHSNAIFEARSRVNLPSWLTARDRELWAPLLTLAEALDRETNRGALGEVMELAKESAQDRGPTFETEAVLGVLEDLLSTGKDAITDLIGQDAVCIHPVELAKNLKDALNREVSPERIASKLRALGFKKADPPRDRQGVIYKIERERLEEIRTRYTPAKDLHTHTRTEPTSRK